MSLGTNALVTAEDLQAVLKPADGDLPVCEAIVDGVSEFFNLRTRRTLKSTVYTALYLNGNGSAFFYLPNAPVVTTVGMTVALGSPTPVLLVLNTDYYLDLASGYMMKVSGEWTKGVHNLLVTYTAGWTTATMPKDLRWACLKQAAHEYQLFLSRAWAETSRSMGGQSVSTSEEHLVPGVKETLQLYERIPS
jgi:uncharacterized membrane protein